MPYVKKPSELKRIEFDDKYQYKAFVCADGPDVTDEGTKSWIRKFQDARNNRPKQAHIITAINPYERFFFTFSEDPFTIDQRLIAMQVQPGYEVEVVAALLNSAVTFLILEMRGTSRNLGALDLNADYLKKLRVLNPDLLSDEQKTAILRAFEPLKRRNVGSIVDEINDPVRIAFDKVVLRSFGLDTSLLSNIYALLSMAVTDRVSMCGK